MSQEMCQEAVNACLQLLKFVPDCFVTNKILQGIDNAVFFNHNIVFVNAYSDVIFFSNDMGLVHVDLEIFALMIIILMMMILRLLFMLDLWLGVIDISKTRHVKNR